MLKPSSNSPANTLELTQARKYAAKPYRSMSLETGRGDFASHVTDSEIKSIRENHAAIADEIEAGEQDHVFAVAQRIHYFLTGECVALLP